MSGPRCRCVGFRCDHYRWGAGQSKRQTALNMFYLCPMLISFDPTRYTPEKCLKSITEPARVPQWAFLKLRTAWLQVHPVCGWLEIALQDFTPCQAAAFFQQSAYGVMVFLVGDPRQRMYRWRGARDSFERQRVQEECLGWSGACERALEEREEAVFCVRIRLLIQLLVRRFWGVQNSLLWYVYEHLPRLSWDLRGVSQGHPRALHQNCENFVKRYKHKLQGSSETTVVQAIQMGHS